MNDARAAAPAGGLARLLALFAVGAGFFAVFEVGFPPASRGRLPVLVLSLALALLAAWNPHRGLLVFSALFPAGRPRRPPLRRRRRHRVADPALRRLRGGVDVSVPLRLRERSRPDARRRAPACARGALDRRGAALRSAARGRSGRSCTGSACGPSTWRDCSTRTPSAAPCCRSPRSAPAPAFFFVLRRAGDAAAPVGAHRGDVGRRRVGGRRARRARGHRSRRDERVLARDRSCVRRVDRPECPRTALRTRPGGDALVPGLGILGRHDASRRLAAPDPARGHRALPLRLAQRDRSGGDRRRPPPRAARARRAAPRRSCSRPLLAAVAAAALLVPRREGSAVDASGE